MPLITFQPAGITVRAEPKTSLLDAARLAGVEIDAPCGGKGTCGNCTVRIITGRVDSQGIGILSAPEVDQANVPTCRTYVQETDVITEIPDHALRLGGQFSDDDGSQLIDPALLPTRDDPSPLTEKINISVPAPQKADGLSDLDRLTRALKRRLCDIEIITPLAAIRNLTDALRAAEGKITVTLAAEGHAGAVVSRRATAVEACDGTHRHHGIVVDVGTTTVAVQLVDLNTTKVLSTYADYNGQLACGLDVISRIDYARRPDRREELRSRVLKTINLLVRQSAGSSKVEQSGIACASLSGNTTMVHLLLGLNPEYIRLDPYTPTVLSTPLFTASEVGIDINPGAPVMISPAHALPDPPSKAAGSSAA